MESLRNRINVKLANNKKRKTRKSKVTLTLKKPVYVDMCILDLSKAFCMNFVIIILKINMVTTQDNSLIV